MNLHEEKTKGGLDKLLGHYLKNWVASHREPVDGRQRLLEAASAHAFFRRQHIPSFRVLSVSYARQRDLTQATRELVAEAIANSPSIHVSVMLQA